MTCSSTSEALEISKVLLEKQLVACVKKLPVGSDFLWKGSIDHNDEILLVMESREDLFDQIEAEVTKLHSYETFVLTATPITKISKKSDKWLIESLLK